MGFSIYDEKYSTVILKKISFYGLQLFRAVHCRLLKTAAKAHLPTPLVLLSSSTAIPATF